MPDWHALGKIFEEAGIVLVDSPPRPVGGGDISAAWCVQTRGEWMFVKTGPVSADEMFAAEAAGLEELESANAVRVPKVLLQGSIGSDSYLALEWLNLGSPTPETESTLGAQLAAQHKRTADTHGWYRNNTIGSTPQVNTRTKSWAEFYRDHRLHYQLELAFANGYSAELRTSGLRLLDELPRLFESHDPSPSLLHGDLWGGNRASIDGAPVIFDPAVYYGDREADLAMTRLFGGFSHAFYSAYENAWPLPPGHEARLVVYQLYHVLNHLNLFGRAYLGRAGTLIRTALAQPTD